MSVKKIYFFIIYKSLMHQKKKKIRTANQGKTNLHATHRFQGNKN